LRHLPTAFGTTLTGLHTLIHVAYLCTTLGACYTHLGAHATDAPVQRRMAQHKVGTCLADFGAVEHQAEMTRLSVAPARFQAVIHRRAQANSVTVQTGLDALLHLVIHLMMHLVSFSLH